MNKQTLIIMDQYCLQCNEKLLGRSDKKFCDDHCRNQYNNSKSRLRNPCISTINFQLRRNRSILELLFARSSNSHLHIRTLAENGFNFYFFTHSEQTKDSSRKYCYDYGYEQVNERQIRLLKWEQENERESG